MNFEWTHEQQAFRARIREFLAANLPGDWEKFSEHGPASPALTAFAREFCAKLAENGMLFPHWPKSRSAARGWVPWEQQILAEVMWDRGRAARRPVHERQLDRPDADQVRQPSAAEAQVSRADRRGERSLWCQGFSEPNSGSDLASLRTRARSGGRMAIPSSTARRSGPPTPGWPTPASCSPGPATIASAASPSCWCRWTRRGSPCGRSQSLIGEGDIHEVFFDDVTRAHVTARLGEEGPGVGDHRLSRSRNERLGIPRFTASHARRSTGRWRS